MNCFDCARQDHLAAPATAVCVECGAGVCERHSIERTVQLFQDELMGRQVPVEPLARAFRCERCDAARQATNPVRRARRGRRHHKENA